MECAGAFGDLGTLIPFVVAYITGITVKVIAQGTGQALDTGRRGDADVVFVHAKEAELQFLKEGQSLRRYPVMYNDFVLIGPKSDPAGIKGMTDIAEALRTIEVKRAPFISRGDRSGTPNTYPPAMMQLGNAHSASRHFAGMARCNQTECPISRCGV